MAATPESVLKDLKNGKYAPLYFLQGDEPFYIDQIAEYIEKNALAEHEKGFNQVVVYGKDADVNTILTHARRFPMMSERQVVIVKEAQNVSDLNRENGQKLLEAYVKNPLPSTILVFSHKYKSLDKRKSLSKSLEKFAIVVSTKKMYDNQVPDWVKKYIKERGHKVTEKAAHMLSEYIGNNLERLSGEIEKILLNFNEPSEITDELVQKYVGISKDYNAFELQKAIAVRDILKANRIVNYFAANPRDNPAIPVIALLFTFFSKLLLVHHAKDKSERTLAGKLRVNPFFVKEYLAASRSYPVSKVMDNIGHIRQADLRAKGVEGGGYTDGELMKELVFLLTH